MPRSFLSFALVAIIVTSMVACSTSPTKPTPPDKTDSGMEMAKGTTSTDMPDVDEPQAPPRPSYTTDEYINKMMAEGQPSAEPPPDVVPEVGTAAVAAVGMDEMIGKKKVEAEASSALVDYYIQQAQRNKKELKYDDALEWVKKALGEAPANQQAIELYNQILAAQGKRTGQIPNELAELQRRRLVQQDEAKTQANYYFNEGKKAFHEERFDAAIDHFENVLTIVNNSPHGTDWGTLKSETEEFLFQSREGKLRADEAAMAEAARMALENVKQDESKRDRKSVV